MHIRIFRRLGIRSIPRDRRFSSFAWPWLLLLVVAAPNPASAQGTQVDYDRAASLRERFRNKVFRDKVMPSWFADNTRFWYRNDLSEETREFIVVDTSSGKREPAFDHTRVAEGLANLTGQPVSPGKLPIRTLEIDADSQAMLLHGDKESWQLDLTHYQLSRAPATTNEATNSLPFGLTPRPSRRTGPETELTFQNKLNEDLELFWSDPDGKEVSYGRLNAGESRAQHTFAGHVWVLRRVGGAVVAVFEAAEAQANAIVDGREPEARPRGGARNRPEGRERERNRGNEASPDGNWEAFIKDNNLHVRAVQSGDETQLSFDGSEETVYTRRVFWSPDSKKLVTLRVREAEEHKVYLIESSPKDQVQPKLQSLDYLKPGDRIAHQEPRLFDIASGKEIPINDELFSNPWRITDIRWKADSSRFTFLYNQRGHQVLRIIAVDALTGQTRAILEETSPTFIDYAGKFFVHYLDDTQEIIWMSERNGWNHLYLYDAEIGQVKNQITRGSWVVRGDVKVDAAKRRLWFSAGGIRPGQDPYYRHFARVNFDGAGLVILTEGDGTHEITYNPDETTFLDTWSRVDQPPITELRRSEDGSFVCELERADASALVAAGWQAPERFAAKGRDGETDIYGIILRPMNFDPNRQYPVVENIYAGPQSAFVPKAFQSYYPYQDLAELGFIVVKIDGMGTSHRSKKFHDVCWKNLKDAGFADRILWMQAAAEKYPYMDLTRVGLYGGSAGGQNTLGGLLFHPEFYKAGVADCGCHDNRMDKIWWNELWMGWPVGPEYEDNSNVTHAGNLQGKLFLTVGELDHNVDPASTMQVVNALIKAGKDFDFLMVPGADHGVGERSEYLRRRRADFFVRHLLGVEPRRAGP